MFEWKNIQTARQQKRQARLNDKKIWRKLKREYPHLLTKEDACNISRRKNIAGLDVFFCDQEIINYQKEGWYFSKIVTPDEEYVPKDGEASKPLNNNYGDVVVFKKLQIHKNENCSNDE